MKLPIALLLLTLATANLYAAPADGQSSESSAKADETAAPPFLVPVPGRPGFYTMPDDPTDADGKPKMMDCRGYPAGTEIKSPYNGKTYRVPPENPEKPKR